MRSVTLCQVNNLEYLFFHALAVMHSPAYQQENLGALQGDWPRIPLPRDSEVLKHSADLGRQLAVLLDPESTVSFGKEWEPLGELVISQRPIDLDRDLRVTAGWGIRGQGATVMPGRSKTSTQPWDQQEAAAFRTLAAQFGLEAEDAIALLGANRVDVYLNGGAYWRGVPESVWEYTLGGYQVLKKWLSYREAGLLGRALKKEEARYFTEVVRRIISILLMGPKLDASYRKIAEVS